MGPAANVGIWCVRLDQPQATAPVAMLQGVAGMSGFSIARDGTIAYATTWTESDLWSLPLSAAGQPSGEPAPLLRDTIRNAYPRFSPDGRHLAFLSWRPGSPWDLWLMNMETRTAELLMPGKDAEFFPTWMPDSRRLLMGIGKGPVRRMARVAIDTRQAEDVQGLPAQMANLTLSPDGRDLAYHAANDTGGMTAWHVPASGGTPVRLSPPQRSAGYPSWSPDGRRLALEVEDGGHTQIWVSIRDGTGFRQVTTSSGQHGRTPGHPTTTGSRLPESATACGTSGPYRRRQASRSNSRGSRPERLRQISRVVSAERPHRVRARDRDGQRLDRTPHRRAGARSVVARALADPMMLQA